MDNYLLALLIHVPLLGAMICALIEEPAWSRRIALGTSLVAAALALVLSWQFFCGGPEVSRLFGQFSQVIDGHFYLESLNFGLRLEMTAVGMWMVLLTVLLMPLALLASFQGIRERERAYYAWMLVLLAAMLGVFVARDLLLFYIFFELTLIPMFFIIGIWGGPDRRAAAGKFFLFTFAGSVFTLVGIVYLGLAPKGPFDSPSFELNECIQYARIGFSDRERFWVLLALLAGFAVKVPLFPVHTWLPLAHTEAPTAGSVILAGVLLKLGTFGLYRLAVPIGLLDQNGVAFPTLLRLLGALCVAGIIYGALIAWVQKDIKKLVAYSSVSHLGFCVLGLLALNAEGVGGSVLYMVNHGLSTGALFLVIGMIYDRYHTRNIDELSGLARRMPRLSFFFVLFAMSSIGLPGLNGFVSEFLTVLGAFTSPHLGMRFGALAALGVILGAVYMLHMVARVVWGPLRTPTSGHEDHSAAADEAAHSEARPPLPIDIGLREIGILVPLALAVIVLGVRPNLILQSIQRPVQDLLQPVARVPGVPTGQAVAEAGPVGAGAIR